MKVLYVTTIEGKDTDALFFERAHTKEEMLVLYNHRESCGNKFRYTFSPKKEDYIDRISVNIEALEFNNVDPKFIDFIRVYIQDYNESKVNNFYIVED